jgi:hypothetical protein
MQWRAWVQCFAVVFTGTLFAVAYYVLATSYIDVQHALAHGKTMDGDILNWVHCIVHLLSTNSSDSQIQNDGHPEDCYDEAAAFIPNQILLIIAEFSISVRFVFPNCADLRHVGCGCLSYSFEVPFSRSGQS